MNMFGNKAIYGLSYDLKSEQVKVNMFDARVYMFDEHVSEQVHMFDERVPMSK